MKDMSLYMMFLAWALVSSNSSVNGDPIFDIKQYGAKGDGITDDTGVFLKVFAMVCNSAYPSPLILVPSGGKFVVRPIDVKGPCKPQYMKLQIDGLIIQYGTKTGSGPRWVTFRSINNLRISGTGCIQGNGARRYNVEKYGEEEDGEDYYVHEEEESKNEDYNYIEEKLGKNIKPNIWNWPTNVAFFDCNHLRIDGIMSTYSERNHISISKCQDVYITNVHLKSPPNSQNTDGIDISHSSYVNILDSLIETGDDCVAINEECSHIYIERLNCGPGHGISIGSFQKRLANVEHVEVRHCTIKDTTNGARIKTFDGGDGGYVRGVIFENITLINVKRPIIIDQFYHELSSSNLLNGSKTVDQVKSVVEISDVKFIGFRGTCSDDIAIYLNCRHGPGCNGITMRDVNIEGSRGQSVRGECYNAHGTAELVSPRVDCLNGPELDGDNEGRFIDEKNS